MKALGSLILAAAAFAITGSVAAQRIEISSPSIGTVVVTPPATGDAATRTGARTTNARGRSGVDLGIQRRADGSLYDPLDPSQNAAAATASTTASPRGSTAGGPAAGASSGGGGRGR